MRNDNRRHNEERDAYAAIAHDEPGQCHSCAGETPHASFHFTAREMAQNNGWYAGQNAKAENGEYAKNQASRGFSIGLRLLPIDRAGIRLLRRRSEEHTSELQSRL